MSNWARELRMRLSGIVAMKITSSLPTITISSFLHTCHVTNTTTMLHITVLPTAHVCHVTNTTAPLTTGPMLPLLLPQHSLLHLLRFQSPWPVLPNVHLPNLSGDHAGSCSTSLFRDPMWFLSLMGTFQRRL